MHEHIRLGLVAVASPLEVGAGEALALQERLCAALEDCPLVTAGMRPAGHDAGGPSLPGQVIPAPRPVTDSRSAVAAGRYFYEQRVDALCAIAASWYEDYLLLDLLEECDVPLIGWARPGMETGSLCGMQQLGFVLQALGRRYALLFDEPDSAQALARAWTYALASSVHRQLRRGRLGFMGHRVEGMTETTGHELAMKKILGPRVVGLDTPTFLERASRVPLAVAEEHWASLQHEVGRVTASHEAGIESLQVYLALKELITECGLDGLAIGCYPHLMGKVCLAASLLAEEGIPLSCEGDINGALGMLVLTRLTGTPVHNTDLLDPIPAHNSIVYSHCGSGGFSLAQSAEAITLGPVRLMNRGLCCLFTARPGPCTLVNLVPTVAGYKLAALYGRALETTMVFPGNPLEVQFASDYRHILEWMAANGLGHHWMAAYGDLRGVLADLATMWGIEFLGKD